jgi:predicted CopG family antitoxin
MTISDVNRIKIAQIAYDLSILFKWDSTKEGGEYWTDVYNRLTKLAKEEDTLSDKLKVYVVYKYDRRDNSKTDLKVYKNETDAKKFCKEHPYVKGVFFDYDEFEAEGF